MVGLTCCCVCGCALCKTPPPDNRRARHEERAEGEAERDNRHLQRHRPYFGGSMELDEWRQSEEHDNGEIHNEEMEA